MTLTPELPGTDVVTGRWLTDHSWNRPSWTVAELEAAKAGRTISVVLPALNEEETVGCVVETITPLLGGLVDELIVLDSGSTDDTEIRAVAAGARVISREVALPEVEPQPGKGEVLWRSLAATTGDIIVFVDSDLIDPDPMFVPRAGRPAAHRRGRAPGQGLLPAAAEGQRQRGRQRRWPGHRAGRAPAARGAAARAELPAAAAGRRIRRHPRAADLGAVRAGLRRGDRAADRHLRPAGPGRDRPGQPRRAGAPQPAADRARVDEPPGHRHPAVALRRPGLRGGADAVLRRRRRLHPAHAPRSRWRTGRR